MAYTEVLELALPWLCLIPGVQQLCEALQRVSFDDKIVFNLIHMYMKYLLPGKFLLIVSICRKSDSGLARIFKTYLTIISIAKISETLWFLIIFDNLPFSPKKYPHLADILNFQILIFWHLFNFTDIHSAGAGLGC